MVFSSLTFIFIFLPIFLLIYFCSKNKYKNFVIFIFSLFFYSWGEPIYVLLMLASILINYILAILIDKFPKKAKLLLVLTCVINFALLFVFKYIDFAIINLNNIFSINIPLVKLSLPIGISFYTFQAVSYVIDVYRKEVRSQKNFITLGAYISLFPQLIAGPIVRYSTIEKQLQKRSITVQKFTDGIRRFIIGLGKKVIIANNVAVIADAILDGTVTEYGWLVLLLGIICYTLQIYFDFSGYSDMAIGLGQMLGFDFLENFNYPYISRSITDFWRRWHISLSTWFRDYVYIPLGGNRVSKIKWIRNILVVWCLTGLWHGASWNFVIWGLYYAIILLIEKLFLSTFLEKLPKALQWLYAIILISIGWAIFRIENIEILCAVLKNLLTFKYSDFLGFFANNYNLLNKVPFVLIALIGCLPVSKLISNRGGYEHAPIYIIRDLWCLLVLALSVCFLIQSTYNPFIYFRF